MWTLPKTFVMRIEVFERVFLRREGAGDNVVRPLPGKPDHEAILRRRFEVGRAFVRDIRSGNTSWSYTKEGPNTTRTVTEVGAVLLVGIGLVFAVRKPPRA